MRPTGSFIAFQNQIIQELHSYWRDHDESHLREVASELKRVGADRPDVQSVSFERQINIRGWTTGASGISARALRKLNPEYKVVIRRARRLDAPPRNVLRLKRSGFVIKARAARGAEGFTYELMDRRGRRLDLPGSHSGTKYKMAYLKPRVGQQPAASVVRGSGYTDSIVVGTRGQDDDPTTWFSALVHNYPDEILDFIDSQIGHPFGASAAAYLRTFRVNAQWADRFALSALGEHARYRSDLRVVKVRRLDTPGVTSGALLPQFREEHAYLRAERGPRKIPSPSGEWLRLERATIQNGGTVLVGDELVAYEAAADPRLGFVAGQWDSIFGSSMTPGNALVVANPAAEEVISEGILLSGRNDANWYHWVVEYLPRLFEIDATIDPGVPLLVTTRTPEAGMQLLHSLTERPVLVLDASLAYEVEVLHVVAPPLQVLDTTKVPWAEGISMRPAPILALRERLRERVGAAAATRRIFLRRSSGHRGLENEARLAFAARKLGFEEVDPGLLSWQEQLELFASARVLVGASGAVMANYLCMARGSRILALTSSTLRGFVLPAVLADLSNVSFAYLTGPPTTDLTSAKHRRDWMHASFSIDPIEFEKAVLNEVRAAG